MAISGMGFKVDHQHNKWDVDKGVKEGSTGEEKRRSQQLYREAGIDGPSMIQLVVCECDNYGGPTNDSFPMGL